MFISSKSNVIKGLGALPGEYSFAPTGCNRLVGAKYFSPDIHYRASKSIILQQKMKTIGICSDHAGFELKQYVKGWLETKGWEYKDFGTYTTESCDYADFAHPLALAVEAGECYPGIAICGSGEGISMTLNKHQGFVPHFAGRRKLLIWLASIMMPTYSSCRDVLSAQKKLI